MYRTFDINPYFSKLIVAVSDEPSKDVTKINIDHPGINLEYTSGKGAVTYMTSYKTKGLKNERQYIIIALDAGELNGPAGSGFAAHEAVHAVNAIFEDIGLKHDYDNDEAQAYLTGWIVERIMEVTEEYMKTKQPHKKK